MRTWDPNAWDKDPLKWGSAGLIWNGSHAPGSLTNGSSGNGWNLDPKYVRSVQDASSEGSGGTNSFEPTDYLNGLLGGKVQVRDLKRLKDPNAVVDGGEEVGWLTDPSNYTDDTDWVDKAFEGAAFAGLGAMPFLHMAGLGGLLGGEGLSGEGLTGGDLPYGTEMPNTYSPGANPTAFYEPLDGSGVNPLSGGDLPHGTEAPNTYAPGTDPSPLGMPPGGEAVSPLARGLGGLLGVNPLQVAGLIGGLFAGGGNSGGGQPSGGGGLLNPMSLPKASRGQWTPNPITQQQIQNFKFFGG